MAGAFGRARTSGVAPPFNLTFLAMQTFHRDRKRWRPLRYPVMGWSGRAPAPPASDACAGHQRQGARHGRSAQEFDLVCTENLSSGVVVVKSAKEGVLFDASDSLNLASDRRILVQGSMRSDAIIIVGVGFQAPTQMHLTQDNDVVHTLTPDRSDQPFGKAILPRRGRCGRLVPDAHGAQSACDDAAIDPIPIADEVARSLIPRKCLGYLTCNPFCRRICCDVDPDEVSAVEPDNDEGIEQVETDSWNNEQVHGGDVRRVVTQEGPPSLAGRPPPFDHVLGDARLGDLKPELEQFAVNAWRTPKRIFDAHPPDQRAQFRVDLRSPSLWARLPTPVAAKGGPMPTHECLGPDDCENLQDKRKPAIQLDKEPAIIVREPDATRQPTPHDIQLMSKHRVLSFKPQLRLEWRGQDGQNETEQPDHSASLGDSVTASTRIRFSVHTAAFGPPLASSGPTMIFRFARAGFFCRGSTGCVSCVW